MSLKKMHVRTYRCTTPTTSAKHTVNGSLASYQISAECVQPFPIHAKRILSCTAHAQMYSTHDLGKTLS